MSEFIGGNDVRVLLDKPCEEIICGYTMNDGEEVEYKRTDCASSYIIGWFSGASSDMGSCNNQVIFRDQNHCQSSEVRSKHAYETNGFTLPNNNVGSEPDFPLSTFDDITSGDSNLNLCDFTRPIQVGGDCSNQAWCASLPWFEKVNPTCYNGHALNLFGSDNDYLPYVRYGIKQSGIDYQDIDKDAISNSSGLLFLYIPKFFYGTDITIDTIKTSAFSNHPDLVGVYFANSQVSLEYNAFDNCPNLYVIYNGPELDKERVKRYFGSSVRFYNGKYVG